MRRIGAIAPLFFIVLLLTGLAPVQAASGQDGPDFAAIDAYIQAHMRSGHLPGVSLAITQGEKIVHLRGFGVADPAGRPMTAQTPMLLGSVTKSFTALAILQLAEAHQLDLDAPVQRYLPWFQVGAAPGGVGQAGGSSSITLRHLLNQTSGLSRLTGEKRMTSGDTSGSALERSVRALSAENLDRQVGASFEYSNANYIVLGMVIQVVSGQPYEDYIQEHIFRPLEMTHSFTSQAEALQQGMSAGYRQWYGFPLPSGDLPYPRGMAPGGYLISSAEDLGHYLIAQMNQGRYGEATILSPQGMAALHAPAVATPEGYHRQPSGSYAMGWYVLDMNGLAAIAHDGDTPNFHADLILIPSGQWGIAVLVNTNTVLLGDDIRNLAAGVASLLSGQPPASAPTPYPVLLLYIFMSGFLVFEIVNLGRLATAWKRPVVIAGPANTFRPWFKPCGLPLLIGLGVAGWMLGGMPVMFQASWPVMLLNQPDLAWVILLGGSLALLNGVLRSGLNAWKLKRRPGAPRKIANIDTL